MDTGKDIKFLRESKGLTQQDLADKVGLSLRTIQRIEKNKNASNLETLNKILSVLGGQSVSGLIRIRELTQQAQDALGDVEQNVNNIDLTSIAKPALEALEDLKDISDGERLIYYFDQLNNDGQKEAVRDVKKLTKIPEYKK
jgi:transcriptional regulator with XRE-family HTH domain